MVVFAVLADTFRVMMIYVIDVFLKTLQENVYPPLSTKLSSNDECVLSKYE